MRLAIYIRTIESARGAEQVVANIVKGLAQKGHLVDLLVEEDRGWLIDSLRSKSNNISIINLRPFYSSGLFHFSFLFVTVLRNLITYPFTMLHRGNHCLIPLIRTIIKEKPPIHSLYGYIHQNRPDAIMSFLNYPNLILLLTAQLCRNKTRFFVNVRNHISSSAGHAKSKWMRNVPHIMRCFFHLADEIVAPSYGVAEDIAKITKLPLDHITVIHNPVFRPELLAQAQEPVDHPWLKKTDVPVIIAAGKLKPQKDFSTLLRAFSIVRSKQPAHLIILGEGRCRTELMGLAKELKVSSDIDFAGYVQNPYAYFSRSSLFVLSSAWEGLPNALIEAMACGCPVVSTDCPSGPAEILDNGTIGKLVPVGDHKAMAQAILETLNSPHNSEQVIEQAQLFSFEIAINQYERLMTTDIHDEDKKS